MTARLVELNPDNAATARELAAAAGLPRVEVVTADAAEPAAYAGLVPADLVLACGVFGNITGRGHPADHRALPPAVRHGRHRHLDPGPLGAGPGPADLRWFGERGFEPAVGVRPGARVRGRRAPVHRHPAATGRTGPRMFRFLTDAEIRQRRGLPPADPS